MAALLPHHLNDPSLPTFYSFFYVDFITLFFFFIASQKFTTPTVRQNSFLYSV
jgi:hypothetical protein